MLSTVARALLALLIVARVAQGQAAAPTRADSLQAAYRRAQRLVTDGQGADGRALMDSLVNAAEPGSSAEADALFWRATPAAHAMRAIFSFRDFRPRYLSADRIELAGKGCWMPWQFHFLGRRILIHR